MSRKQRIVAMLPARNESSRYLGNVLAHLIKWVDVVVVLDDASDDDTAKVAVSFSGVVLYQNNTPQFLIDEYGLRSKLWELAVRETPDWILAIDADEIFEDRIINEVVLLLEQNDYDVVYFRHFNFWKSGTHYRTDGLWNPWQSPLPLMVRYKPEIGKVWYRQNDYCARFPQAYEELFPYYSDIRVQHLGWANAADHEQKYRNQRERDLKMIGDESLRTKSICDPDSKISLEEWRSAKSLYFLTGGTE